MSDDVLVSDAEREAAALELRTHLADGRLTTDEFGERLDTVYAARTRAEVAAALERLPERPPPPPPRRSAAAGVVQSALGLATPFLICTVIWALTGMHGGFWPKWLLIPVVVGVLTQLRRASAR